VGQSRKNSSSQGVTLHYSLSCSVSTSSTSTSGQRGRPVARQKGVFSIMLATRVSTSVTLSLVSNYTNPRDHGPSQHPMRRQTTSYELMYKSGLENPICAYNNNIYYALANCRYRFVSRGFVSITISNSPKQLGCRWVGEETIWNTFWG